MFHVILYQPEIPPNTGNIIRLCANTGADLHLVKPMPFDMDEPRLRRAGLDYHEFARVTEHESLDNCLLSIGEPRLFALSTKAPTRYDQPRFHDGDTFLFGPETRGLPAAVIESLPVEQRLRIPLRPNNRSLNLANAVAIVIYEAWRQSGFPGGS